MPFRATETEAPIIKNVCTAMTKAQETCCTVATVDPDLPATREIEAGGVTAVRCLADQPNARHKYSRLRR